VNVLTPTTQQHVEDTLVEDGVISKEQLILIKEKAKQSNEPFFSLLVNEGHVSDEDLTKALATVSNVPYVNLSVARIEPKTLDLLSQDIAEHYMAVPLGKMQNRLVVAMLDADNVQAVDFLSNKIGKPLKSLCRKRIWNQARTWPVFKGVGARRYVNAYKQPRSNRPAD
jgi:type IV pilus assembly protein PilB